MHPMCMTISFKQDVMCTDKACMIHRQKPVQGDECLDMFNIYLLKQ